MNVRLRILVLCIAVLMIIPMIKLTHTKRDLSTRDSFKRASVATTSQQVTTREIDGSIQGLKSARVSSHAPLNTSDLFGSFTTLPNSLRNPVVSHALSNYIALQSQIVTMIGSTHRSEAYEPPPLGDGTDDPTDEQIEARDAYDRTYHEHKIAQARTQDVSSHIPSIEYARTNLIQTIGEHAYAEFRQWQKAEYIASILSWHLPEETTRSSAESIVKLWVEGHTTTVIFNLVTDVSPITSDVGEPIIMVLRQ
jgi:hypothetical protein